MILDYLVTFASILEKDIMELEWMTGILSIFYIP